MEINEPRSQCQGRAGKCAGLHLPHSVYDLHGDRAELWDPTGLRGAQPGPSPLCSQGTLWGGVVLLQHHKQDFEVSLQEPVTFLWGEWTDHTLICHRSQGGICHYQSTQQDTHACSQLMPGLQRPQTRVHHDFWVNRTHVYPGK